jgi:hypothetical protein
MRWCARSGDGELCGLRRGPNVVRIGGSGSRDRLHRV